MISALRTCRDPEIPVDIYELGLIYGVTLTAPNCPAAQELPAEVERKVRSVPGVTDANVEIAAKLKLGLL